MAGSGRMTDSRDWLGSILPAVVGGIFLSTASACNGQEATSTEHDIGVLHVRGNIYMLVGETANVTAQIGSQGILLVDTMKAEMSDELLDTISTLSDQPIRHIINTHVHPDHTGGNAAIAQAGDPLFNEASPRGGVPIYAHQNVLRALSAQESPPPYAAWPTSTYLADRKDLYFNGEAVRILHLPNAHTNGDSIVFFRQSDVISTGDIFVTTGYPYIDVADGGTIAGIIEALNRIIELAVPEAYQEGGTLIIPGHGRLCDASEVVEYRDMLTIIRSFIQERIDEGMSLEEVQAARPTAGYDPRYGTDSGFWTTEEFVAAIYNELKRGKE